MRTLILSLALLVVCSTESHAASRTWKDRKGNEIKAEFTGGVLQNKIVLKASGNRRIYVRLSELSLEDRDYLVEQLTAKDNQKDLDMLKALMLAENQVPFIDPDAPKANRATGGGNGGSPVGSESGNPFNPLENPNAASQTAEVPTEMYGLPLPSQELLMDDSVRAWTSLTGLKQMASFDRLLAPGFLRLKKADGTKGTFALVNFTKADIDYVKEALQKDMAREVFPEGNGFQSLTPEDISKGYKVWTDRKNVPLIGKFIAVKAKNVVIEVNGEQREYPKAGLSQADRDWVDAEIKRQQDAAAQQRQANAQNRPSPFGSTGTGESGGTRTRSGIYYKHTCPICGKRWDDDSPFTKCSDCVGKTQYRCFRCLHTFVSTEANPKCPHCVQKDAEFARNTGYPPTTNSTASSSHGQNSRSSYTPTPSSTSNSSPTSFGSSSTSGGDSGSSSGLLMTILYVAMGLGLLGGIAAGLFKAFG